MTKVEIVKAGERISTDVTAYVSQPTSPVTAQPVNVGLVEISQSQPTELIPGPVGPQGSRGSRWTTGTGDPIATDAIPGDMYLDDATGDVWTWDGTVWVNTGTDIEGPQGPQGIPGTIGVDGAPGPANSLAIGTVTTVAPGGAATSTITGTPPTQTLNLGIPTGATGATGAVSTVPGPQGPQGTQGAAGTTTLTVADAAPASPQPGTLWFESDTGNTFLWYVDADSSQWVQVSGAVSARPTAEIKSRVVNGAFQISQEQGNTAGTTVNFYAADQWLMSFVSTGTFTFQRVQVTTPNGSINRLRTTITVADAALAASDYLWLQQNIEGVCTADFGWGTASARQVILRFGFKAPAGTYSIAIFNNAGNRSYIANFTISAGQANTDTVQTFVIPGDATGTWPIDTARSMGLFVTLAAGTTFQGVAGWQAGFLFRTSSNTNGMATAGAVFELYDVGLYLDPLATGVAPRWEMPDETQELVACMRYWQKYFCIVDTSTVFSDWAKQVVMRIAPAMTGGGTGFTNYASSEIMNSFYQTTRASQTMVFNARM